MKSTVTTITTMLEEDAEYIIPHFQRPYAWRVEQQWSPLWDDIKSVAENIGATENPDAVPPHFMGPLVLQERLNGTEPKSYIVVDGQQRMTTILILMKAFADACRECDLSRYSTQFLMHIWNTDGNGNALPKVRHLHKRNSVEMNAVLNDYSGHTDLNGRIAYCHDFFRTRAVEYLRHSKNPEKACVNLLQALNLKLETAVLTLNSNEQPNKVFETLNARGEPLRQAELIKNTIMYEGNVIENEDLADHLWNRELEHPPLQLRGKSRSLGPVLRRLPHRGQSPENSHGQGRDGIQAPPQFPKKPGTIHPGCVGHYGQGGKAIQAGA